MSDHTITVYATDTRGQAVDLAYFTAVHDHLLIDTECHQLRQRFPEPQFRIVVDEYR